MSIAGQKLLMLGFLIGTLGELAGCGAVSAPSPERARPALPQQETTFTATAYSGGGLTASGTQPHRGIVAADPAVLPMGSRIRVHGAGPYSGEYVVRDTGGKIRGRKIDIYLPRHTQAKRFGRHHVRVEVLQYGHGHRGRACTRHCTKYRRHRGRHHPGTTPSSRVTASTDHHRLS